MTVYESELRPANLSQLSGRKHIYIKSFRGKLPADVVGGPGYSDPSPRLIRLEFGSLVRTHSSQLEKTASGPFHDRWFVEDFFTKTGAEEGDTVISEEVTPYHLQLSLKKKSGKTIRP